MHFKSGMNSWLNDCNIFFKKVMENGNKQFYHFYFSKMVESINIHKFLTSISFSSSLDTLICLMRFPNTQARSVALREERSFPIIQLQTKVVIRNYTEIGQTQLNLPDLHQIRKAKITLFDHNHRLI